MKFPYEYGIKINEYRYHIQNVFSSFYEISYRNNINFKSRQQFNFSLELSRHLSLRKHINSIRFNDKFVGFVCLGNKILYYKVYTDKLPFQSAKKVKPKKPFDKLLLKN